MRRRVQAGANVWRQVEGVMSDRHISKKLKGKVLGARVTPAMLYGLETLLVTEKDCRCVKQLGEADCWSEESAPEEDGRAERGG